MQRGTAQIFLGIGMILLGIMCLKITDLNFWWAAIALGAALGVSGGVQLSQRSRA